MPLLHDVFATDKNHWRVFILIIAVTKISLIQKAWNAQIYQYVFLLLSSGFVEY